MEGINFLGTGVNFSKMGVNFRKTGAHLFKIGTFLQTDATYHSPNRLSESAVATAYHHLSECALITSAQATRAFVAGAEPKPTGRKDSPEEYAAFKRWLMEEDIAKQLRAMVVASISSKRCDPKANKRGNDADRTEADDAPGSPVL